MIPVKPSNTTNSSIIAMGERLVKAMHETGQEYLMLNRGINSVVNIDLKPLIDRIDFNSNEIQFYPGDKGKIKLRKAINDEYFAGKANTNNILVTGGGIVGLDIVFQNIAITEVLLPPLFWGTYTQLLNLREINYNTYESYESLKTLNDTIKGKAVVICDPGNPLGEKYDDNKLISLIEKLNSLGAIVIIDCPYRRLFFNNTDSFYQKLLPFENVIIVESFSKSLGLSGQRIGFIHNSQPLFIKEAALRISYATNGINSFAQVLVTQLLSSLEGKRVVANFKKITTQHIAQNIRYLQENNLLATNFYNYSIPIGIFAVVNKSSEELFKNKIGSIDLNYFSLKKDDSLSQFSRILVAIPHEKFVSFFKNII